VLIFPLDFWQKFVASTGLNRNGQHGVFWQSKYLKIK